MTLSASKETAMDSELIFDHHTKTHMDVAALSFETLRPLLFQWVKMGVETIENGGKIIFFGNGGSAADAQHIAAELSVKLSADRAPIAGLALNLDASAMTACGNDYGFEFIFSRQIQALGKKEDLAVGISTSGNSKNVMKALDAARAMGMKTVGLSGKTGGIMDAHCDLLIKIPTSYTAAIQEMHITFGHLFCALLEKELGLV